MSAGARLAPESQDTLFTREGAIATLTFNRPQARNAMTFAMYERLAEVCEQVDGDDAIRVLVLTGAGDKAFVAGTDISQFQEFRTPEDALAYEERMDRVIGRLEGMRKPAVAAIRGVAAGGGASIALACDLRICTPASRLGIPIARTLGNCLSINNYARLVDLIGPSRTKELIYLAKLMPAAEALAIGLVNEVVADEQALEARVREVAETIAQHAPLTIQTTKQAVREIVQRRRKDLADLRELILSCYLSEDFQEGVRAFLEKRPARWQGK
jgi:enoyl-CoA hydratase/carnithine racemase